MENFAGEGGLLPEQVWDTYENPERGFQFGRPSGSAMPLTIAWTEPWRQRRQFKYELVPSVVRIEGADHDHENEGGRSPFATDAGIEEGAASIR